MKAFRLLPLAAGRVSTWCIISMVFVFGVTYGQGQPPVDERPDRIRGPVQAPIEKPKVFHGRLPSYYGSVVDDRQRQQIYAIQRRYFAQIEGLKAQLAAVTERRNAEVAAVLLPQQHAEVQRLKAEAKAKRDAKKKRAGEGGR